VELGPVTASPQPASPPALIAADRGVLRRGAALLVAANLLFAIGFSFVAASDGAVSVWQIVLLRGVVFGLVLLPWAVAHPQAARGSDHRLLVTRGVLGTLMLVCLLSAVIALPLSIATLLAKTTPLWALLVVFALFALRPLLGELLLVPVALLGLALILHPEGHLDLLALSVGGLLLGLASGLFNSLELVTLSRLRRRDPAPTINLWFAGVGIALMLPLALAHPGPAAPVIWLYALAFSLCSLGGQMLLAHAMHAVPPTIASIGTLLVPVFATVIAWIALGQRLSGLELVGIAIVLIAGALAIRLESRQGVALAAAPWRWDAMRRRRAPPPSAQR
jgi:drug/metabolite transporter (DMT)-like permease